MEVLIFLLFFANIETAPITIIVDIVKTCSNNNQLANKISNFTFHNERGKVVVSYHGELTETLKKPLEMRTEGTKCNLQKTQCSSIPGINYADLCPILSESYYGKVFFSKLEPPVTKCPVKPVWNTFSVEMV